MHEHMNVILNVQDQLLIMEHTMVLEEGQSIWIMSGAQEVNNVCYIVPT